MRWRVWPLVDDKRWSWLVLCLTGAIAVGVWYVGGSALFAIAVLVGLLATGWQFYVPVEFEVSTLGLRRKVAHRSRTLPWHAIRTYRLRPTGIVVYQRPEPSNIDVLRSVFIPYPPDPDELIFAMRLHAPHAAELAE